MLGNILYLVGVSNREHVLGYVGEHGMSIGCMCWVTCHMWWGYVLGNNFTFYICWRTYPVGCTLPNRVRGVPQQI